MTSTVEYCHRLYTLPLLIFGLLLSGPSLPQADLSTSGLPHNFPTERRIIDASQSPWHRIGNLSIAGRQFCSASLIADNIVITAAHCLWNTDTQTWYPVEFIHFLAGYQQEDYVAHSRAASIHPNPAYQFDQQGQASNLLNDWALIELQEPVGALLGYFPLEITAAEQQYREQQTRSPIALAGYRRDTREALSLDQQCTLIPTPTTLPKNFLTNNCHGLSGDSGGPILIHHNQQWHLIGIHAGRHISSTRTLALGIPAREFYDQLLALLSQTSFNR
ncbi:MAG: hypothetical protein CL693_07460 [Cellvibrionaceae bacterium]|nr:hypothetical protein [Cellvibrionaceae bacterium]|tara:strand:+ start:40486 stop:41313 length:828 start_codon:yes stop_codon:yes gene_type:complete